MKKIFLFVVLSLLPIKVFAAAEGYGYTVYQYALGSYSEMGMPDSSPKMLVGRFGRYYGDGISVEGRLGISVGDEQATTIQGKVYKVEVDVLTGIYALKHADLGDGMMVYGIMGYTDAKFTMKATGDYRATDESGLSFGMGLDMNGLNIEFLQYLDEADFNYSTLSLGMTF